MKNARSVLDLEVSVHQDILFLSDKEEMDCPYLPNRISRMEFVYPIREDPVSAYAKLMPSGFRRTGFLFYQTVCDGCAECVSIRLDPQQFRLSKSQERNLRANAGIRVTVGPSEVTAEKAGMFSRYVTAFHGRDSAEDTAEEIRHIHDGFAGTVEMDLWLEDRLAGVGILDVCGDAVSSVYFYHDPALRKRGLGTYSALKEIEYCREHGIRHYYLGYVVAGCKKMEYKTNFRPYELLKNGVWVPG